MHAGDVRRPRRQTVDEIELLKQSAAIADACILQARYEMGQRESPKGTSGKID